MEALWQGRTGEKAGGVGQLNLGIQEGASAPGLHASGHLLMLAQLNWGFPRLGSGCGTELSAEIQEKELFRNLHQCADPRGPDQTGFLLDVWVGCCDGLAFPWPLGWELGWGIPDC